MRLLREVAMRLLRCRSEAAEGGSDGAVKG